MDSAEKKLWQLSEEIVAAAENCLHAMDKASRGNEFVALAAMVFAAASLSRQMVSDQKTFIASVRLAANQVWDGHSKKGWQ